MMAQPNNVIVKNIGLATLNTLTFRWRYMYPAKLNVNSAHNTEMVSNDIRNAQLYVAKHGRELTQCVQPGSHALHRKTSS